ncbi:WYL domain-containing protein [Trueperella sp. LYQ143]|uniref:WYL domain-containing protein n=1 Tax=unclassified Trueperella TaxID=2630174 RepID=UPI003983A3C5
MSDIELARKIAILTKLARKDMSIREIARELQMRIADVQLALTQLATLERQEESGFYSTLVDLDYQLSELDEPVVLLTDESHLAPYFSLFDVVCVLTVIGQLLSVVSEHSSAYDELIHVRHVLLDALERAGYAQVLWMMPLLANRSPVMHTVLEAINRRLALDIVYLKSRDTPRVDRPVQERIRILPTQILLDRRAYLVARRITTEATISRSVRHYRIDRIAHAQLCTDIVVSEKTRNEVNRSARAARFCGVDVTLTCRSAGRWLAEEIADARCRFVGENIQITFPVARLSWLFSLALQLGPDLLRIEPTYVADALGEYARDYCQYFEDNQDETI